MTGQNGPDLRSGRTHEVVASEAGDAAARVFAAWVAANRGTAKRTGICLWIAGGRMPPLCPHGLSGLLDPDALIIVEVGTPLDGLWTAEEGLRSGAVGTVVLESERPLDLLQSRRLQLASEAGGAVGLFLGPDSGNTAAETRWRCRALPSTDARTIRFDWRQVKNKRGPSVDREAHRDEATGRMRMVAVSVGGAGIEECARPGPTLRGGGGGGQRLEALLAEHGGP